MANLDAERRRLRLLRRQWQHAQIARKEALAALAQAVAEEGRSADLANRSRALLREHGHGSQGSTGADLRSSAAFAHALRDVSKKADQAHSDASDQARWHRQELAAKEERARRFAEKVDGAQRSAAQQQEARDQAHEPQMARKLLNRTGTQSRGKSES